MLTPSNFRRYILGSIQEFPSNNSLFKIIKELINTNNRFYNLLLIIILTLFIVFVIAILRRKHVTGNFIYYVLGGIILYSAFCIEKSLQIKMERQSPIIHNKLLKKETPQTSFFDGFLKLERKLNGSYLAKSLNTIGISNIVNSKIDKDFDTIAITNRSGVMNESSYLNLMNSNDKLKIEHQEYDGKKIRNIEHKDEETTTVSSTNKTVEDNKSVDDSEDKKRSTSSKNKKNESKKIFKEKKNLVKSQSKNEENEKTLKNPENKLINETSGKKELVRKIEEKSTNGKDEVKNEELSFEPEIISKSKKKENDVSSIIKDKDIHQNDDSEYEGDEKERYLERINSNITFKKETDASYESLINDTKILKDKTMEYFIKFENIFNLFINESKKIKNEISSIDIALDLYPVEVQQFKAALEQKFSLVKENIVIDKSKLETDKPIVEYHLETPKLYTPNLKPIQSLFQKIRNTKKLFQSESNNLVEKSTGVLNSSKMKNLPILINPNSGSIHKNIDNIEIILVIQAILCLLLFVIQLCELTKFTFFFKFLILICLFGNIILGIVTMIYGQILEKSCINKEIPDCAKDSNLRIAGIIHILKKSLNIDPAKGNEDQVKLVQTEFKKIAYDADSIMKEMKKYIEESVSDVVFQKIMVFEDMFRKIDYLNPDFDTLMGNKVKKDDYYNLILDMRRMLERIKVNVKKINTGKIIDIYKNFAQLQFFFLNESANISQNIKSIIASDAKNVLAKKKIKCEKSVEMVCRGFELHDTLYATLIIVGGIFSILLAF
ncbi:hypothetical protein TCON_0032 [Astathelohania contejeani]|uniref:Uncharacterized protein n=1 Tax=Astathelohania contejeani TaxID=164912 RepID=A0ABQ7I326_9MICR|nr:hypothetical protein TCON_0032 [Thelohania contejeani]